MLLNVLQIETFLNWIGNLSIYCQYLMYRPRLALDSTVFSWLHTKVTFYMEKKDSKLEPTRCFCLWTTFPTLTFSAKRQSTPSLCDIKKQRWHFPLICCWSPRAGRKQHKLLLKNQAFRYVLENSFSIAAWWRWNARTSASTKKLLVQLTVKCTIKAKIPLERNYSLSFKSIF